MMTSKFIETENYEILTAMNSAGWKLLGFKIVGQVITGIRAENSQFESTRSLGGVPLRR
jgi:hypothetical protein